MPGPRADFECGACGVLWQDLPTTLRQCPGCGGEEAWRRLYNAVHVSTRGHRIARFVDGPVERSLDAYRRQQDRVKAAQQQQAEAAARAWERASPALREHLDAQGLGPDRVRRQGLIEPIPAAGPGPITGLGLLSRDPQAAQASRTYTWPVVDALAVRPIPVK